MRGNKYGKEPEWHIFEEEVAEFLNGFVQKGSGNGPVHKGDVKCDDYLVECKYTSKDYYNLNVKIWEKISDEARNINKTPLFACRGSKGDFLVGSTLDFDYDDNLKFILKSKNCKIDGNMIFTLKGEYCDHNLVSWSVTIGEEY